eukprot:6178122-Pleurochrysis_carterae.AAC.1
MSLSSCRCEACSRFIAKYWCCSARSAQKASSAKGEQCVQPTLPSNALSLRALSPHASEEIASFAFSVHQHSSSKSSMTAQLLPDQHAGPCT